MRPLQMINWDLGEMKLGLFEVRFPALKILEILFVLVNKAAYTTVKLNPAPNLNNNQKIRYCWRTFLVLTLTHQNLKGMKTTPFKRGCCVLNSLSKALF